MDCPPSVQWDSTNHHVDMGTVSLLEDDVDEDSVVFVKSEPTLIPGGNDHNPFYLGFNFHALNPLTSQHDSKFPGRFTSAGSLIAHPTFDFNNMFRAHFGVSSCFGPQSEEFLAIQ